MLASLPISLSNIERLWFTPPGWFTLSKEVVEYSWPCLSIEASSIMLAGRIAPAEMWLFCLN
jgi:hypothetical protein